MNEIAKIARLKADSLIKWWEMAGVDYVTNENPENWLSPAEDEAEDVNAISAPVAPVLAQENAAPSPRPQAKPQTAPEITAPPVIDSSQWPNDMAQLISAIKAGENLPSNGFGGKSAAPFGDIDADLMVIMDLPDAQEIENGQLTSSQSGELLKKMLAAMGHDMDKCYITSLAATRPAIGEIPEEALGDLAKFALHQMQLVRPQIALILGTAACQALLNAELMTARKNLHYFNHDGQKVTALTTFHPRTLLARPILKAQAWKDMQMLMLKDGL